MLIDFLQKVQDVIEEVVDKEKLQTIVGGLTQNLPPSEPEPVPEPVPEPGPEPEPEIEREPEIEKIYVDDEDYTPVHNSILTLHAQKTKLCESAAKYELERTNLILQLAATEADMQEHLSKVKNKLGLAEEQSWSLQLPSDTVPHAYFFLVEEEE